MRVVEWINAISVQVWAVFIVFLGGVIMVIHPSSSEVGGMLVGGGLALLRLPHNEVNAPSSGSQTVIVESEQKAKV